MTTQLRTEQRPMAPRENLREEPARLTRRRGLTTDKFHVPDHLVPPGQSWEWKRMETMGARDVEHQVELAENHWRSVQAKDAPGMMPAGHEGPVIRGGCVLMARPSYLTEEAQQEVLDIARSRVKMQEKRLGLSEQGTLPRTKPQISRDYSPVTAADRASVRQIPD